MSDSVTESAARRLEEEAEAICDTDAAGRLAAAYKAEWGLYPSDRAQAPPTLRKPSHSQTVTLRDRLMTHLTLETCLSLGFGLVLLFDARWTPWNIVSILAATGVVCWLLPSLAPATGQRPSWKAALFWLLLAPVLCRTVYASIQLAPLRSMEDLASIAEFALKTGPWNVWLLAILGPLAGCSLWPLAQRYLRYQAPWVSLASPSNERTHLAWALVLAGLLLFGGSIFKLRYDSQPLLKADYRAVFSEAALQAKLRDAQVPDEPQQGRLEQSLLLYRKSPAALSPEQLPDLKATLEDPKTSKETLLHLHRVLSEIRFTQASARDYARLLVIRYYLLSEFGRRSEAPKPEQIDDVEALAAGQRPRFRDEEFAFGFLSSPLKLLWARKTVERLALLDSVSLEPEAEVTEQTVRNLCAAVSLCHPELETVVQRNLYLAAVEARLGLPSSNKDPRLSVRENEVFYFPNLKVRWAEPK